VQMVADQGETDPDLIIEGPRSRKASAIQWDHEAWVEREEIGRRERQEVARRRAEKRGAPILEEEQMALSAQIRTAPLTKIKIPHSFKEAMREPGVWIPVMDVEMDGLVRSCD